MGTHRVMRCVWTTSGSSSTTPLNQMQSKNTNHFLVIYMKLIEKWKFLNYKDLKLCTWGFKPINKIKTLKRGVIGTINQSKYVLLMRPSVEMKEKKPIVAGTSAKEMATGDSNILVLIWPISKARSLWISPKDTLEQACQKAWNASSYKICFS